MSSSPASAAASDSSPSENPPEQPGHISVTVRTPIHHSFRVAQVGGIFDLPIPDESRETFSVELPTREEVWQIGLIVGPSGSGKSTIARAAYGEQLYQGHDWAAGQALVDAFGEHDVRVVTQTLSAVGLSSPPSWIKPYHVLSNGEKFRCDLAQAILGGGDLVVFDEFTSVVDRTVAKVGSAAISKMLRRDLPEKRFVAVSCHYDIAEWLEPDWVLDMASRTLARRRLRRPKLELEIRRVPRTMWRLFQKHHYLSTSLAAGAWCWCAFVDGQPAAFDSWIHHYGGSKKPTRRHHRTVTLPDFQGLGIGTALINVSAAMWSGLGFNVVSTTSHPALTKARANSPLWRLNRQVGLSGSRDNARETGDNHKRAAFARTRSVTRLTSSWRYIGPALPYADATAAFASL